MGIIKNVVQPHIDGPQCFLDTPDVVIGPPKRAILDKNKSDVRGSRLLTCSTSRVFKAAVGRAVADQ